MDPLLARALEVILIVHMDHEQNASTSTVRTAGAESHQETTVLSLPGQVMGRELKPVVHSLRQNATDASCCICTLH